MSEVVRKDGRPFKPCRYCGNLVWLHSASGNPYGMVVHLDQGTDILCRDCAKKIGAFRTADDYRAWFIFDGELFTQYGDHWMALGGPNAEDFEDLDLTDYGAASAYELTAPSSN
jgi:hypothetical protein